VGFTVREEVDLSLLTHESEVDLIKALMQFPDTLARAAQAREPHRVAAYLRDVAAAFTQFYGQCRIIGEADDLASARMHLAMASKTVLGNGLAVLGISAPERM
jgi:arginyl-tRNA synthetase